MQTKVSALRENSYLYDFKYLLKELNSALFLMICFCGY